jgi:DNA repair exonuclease SbcCD ATPase subunit
MINEDVIRERVESLVQEARLEVAGWSDASRRTNALLAKATALADRASNIAPPSISDLNLNANDLIENLNPQINDLQRQLKDRVDLILAMATELFYIPPVQRNLDGNITAIMQYEVQNVQSRLTTFQDAQAQAWTNATKAVAENVEHHVSNINTTAEDLESNLQQLHEEAIDELAQVAEEIVDALTEVADDTETHLESVIDDATEWLETEGKEWEDHLRTFGGSIEGLQEQVQELERDLSAIYSLVMTGMQSTGIGMEVTASTLNDLRSIMGDVT